MPTIDTTAPVIGPAAPTQPKATTKKNDALGKDEFLKLLVAQMKNQDPLNPMDGQQMAAQLAQFSSVEQLVTANDTLAKIRELLSTATTPATDGTADGATESTPPNTTPGTTGGTTPATTT
jgi:flagellar hook assembly protein FlgD